MRVLLIAAGGLLAVLIAFYVLRNPKPSPAMQRLAELAELAERTCLSNTTETSGVKIGVKLEALKHIDAGAGLEEQKTAARGASDALADALKVAENDQIRTCMGPWAQQIRDLAGRP